MPQAIDHPVFGRLVWNADLMCFREFPEMRIFYRDRRGDTEWARSSLSDEERQLVENWRDQPPRLAKICRNSNVYSALQSYGVYEVSVELGERGREPIEPQAAAYQYFEQNEGQICRNACEALLRYYHVARSLDPDWFEFNDCPECDSIEELTKLVEFDGISISQAHAGGLSTVRLAWRPDWDMEHGLGMTLWRDQVVCIGADVDVEEMADEPDYYVWGRAQMKDQERAALDELLRDLVLPDDDDPSD